MREFFYPDSVAVIGVSSSTSNLARRILHNLRRFHYTGRIYGVGPREEEVEGVRLHSSILDLPEAVDLAVLLIPAKNIPSVAEECGRKGVKRLVIESGGFREFEGSRSDVERETLEVCRRHGIRFIGPNCIGIINRDNGLCTPFVRFIAPFQPGGGVSVLSQSGGVGASYIQDLTSEHVGISKFVSFGNGLDIDEVELISYLGEDPDTTVISCYLEGISRGREFLRAVSRLTKPVVVFKSNTQPQAHPIATSHSAALSGDDDVLDAAFRQVGIQRVNGLQEWASVTKGLMLPPMRGSRLAILSRSGGHAVLAADEAERQGFCLPPFPSEFFESCRQYFERSVITLQNPLDLGQIYFHAIFTHVLEETLKLDSIDGVIFLHMYDSLQEADTSRLFVANIVPLMQKYQKPVAVFLASQRDERQYVRENYRLPLFRTPGQAVRALATSRSISEALARRRPFDLREGGLGEEGPPIAQLIREKAKGERPDLSTALGLFKDLGVTLAPYRVVHSREELSEAARALDYPLALKMIHARASHKTDVGGVQINLRDEGALIAAWDDIAREAERAGLEGGLSKALLQKMSDKGWELFVGAKRDKNFGPVVLAGAGGVLAEVIRDVAMRVAPITEADAREMLDETRASRLLKGFRSQPPADVEALVRLLRIISRMMIERPDIDELDLNPVIVHPAGEGLTVVDARIEWACDVERDPA